MIYVGLVCFVLTMLWAWLEIKWWPKFFVTCGIIAVVTLGSGYFYKEYYPSKTTEKVTEISKDTRLIESVKCKTGIIPRIYCFAAKDEETTWTLVVQGVSVEINDENTVRNILRKTTKFSPQLEKI